ncbi:MAG: alpha-2-macroglobulin family protein [Stappiaceae bacterium]
MNTRSLFHFLFTGLFLLVVGSVVQAQTVERRIVTVPDADYFGSDYKTVKDVDLEACKTACLDDNICQAFTYNTSANWCFMKSDFGDLQTFPGAVAGRVVDVHNRAEVVTADREAELAFLPQGIRDDAQRFGLALSRKFPGTGSHQQLVDQAFQARQQGRNADSAKFYGQALALTPEAFGLWINFSSAALAAEPDDWRQRQQMEQDAVSGAINAYLRSATKSEQLTALGLLGQGLAKRQIWKPAIKTYRAALAVEDDPNLRARYDQLIAEHGFRILSHQVDSNAVSPRICLLFSEKLQKSDATLADFIKVAGEGVTTVDVDDTQICVDGVAHGQRYIIKVRAGLPSLEGERIEKSSDLSIYVRDRQPSARFAGQAYVLPAGKDASIPVVTVNTARVEARIFRIGDRGIAPFLQDDTFLKQLGSYQIDQIENRFGSAVWKGEVDVRRDLNQDVTTAIPLAEIGLATAPGAYVLTVRPRNESPQEQWGQVATQWFIVSDLGLTAFTGQDGVHVFVRSLGSAAPVKDVDLRLVAVNNEILGSGSTDEKGYLRFDPGLARGKGGLAPAVLVSETADGDYAFLDLDRPPFDLSDRGVEGREAPGPQDVFLYTERGVYRPGADIYASALIRDDQAQARVGVPLTLLLKRPDGVEFARQTLQDAGAGGYSTAFSLPAGAMQGPWTIEAKLDAKGDALAEQTILVEDFEPERVDYELVADNKTLSSAEPVTISIDAQYLYGSPASDQTLAGELRLKPTRAWPDAHKGYFFGLADEQIIPVSTSIPPDLKTDAEGKLSFELASPDLPSTTQLWRADLVTRLTDAGGRSVERTLDLGVKPARARLGIKPLFDPAALGEGSEATFDVVLVSAEGQPIATKQAAWTLSKIETSYQWYRQDGRYSYESVSRKKRVANGTIDVAPLQPARISRPADWGRYVLEVTVQGDNATAASVEFNAGWYTASATVETPDVLEVALDKKSYRSGDTALLRLKPRFDGVALVNVVTDRLVYSDAVAVKAGDASVSLKVTDEWGVGAYVTAALYRPMDLEAKVMPSRSLGLQWLAVDPGKRHLQVSSRAPENILPRQTLSVPIEIADLVEGEQAYVTVAAVDVGILNLTGFESPAPDKWYFGQRKLGTEIRDLYGLLIDRMTGSRGRVRSGGDGGGLGIEGPPPTEKPLSLFSGIVSMDSDGKATVDFEIPDFNGSLRLMTVAWSEKGVGHAEQDIIVRDPVVMTASLPKFMAPGDRSRLFLTIDNVEGPDGNYDFLVESTDPIGLSTGTEKRALELNKGQKSSVLVPILAHHTGNADLTLTLTGPDNASYVKNLTLGIEDLQPEITRKSTFSLSANGGTVTVGGDLLTGLKSGSARVTLSSSAAGALDVVGLLEALDRYPYGCTEQLTSRALPLLYLNQVAQSAGVGTDSVLRERVQKAIIGVLGNQSSSGGFGLWSSYSESDLWLDSYVADFLGRAKQADYAVPSLAFEQALDNLQNRLAYASDFSDGGEGIAYALYVLAKNGKALVGDLRYYADTKLNDFASPLAKAQLGAGLALYGENQRADLSFNAALKALGSRRRTGYEADYGSSLRDMAGIVTLASETKPAGISLASVTQRLEKTYVATNNLSTQDMAWTLLAAHGLIEAGSQSKLSVNGVPAAGPLFEQSTGEDLGQKPIVVSNEGARSATLSVTVSGVPTVPEPAGGNGMTVTRALYSMDGTPLDLAAIRQNDRFVVVVKITANDQAAGRLLLVDRLPAGVSIDNPRLLQSGDVATLGWLQSSGSSTHTEFREDRFVVAFDRRSGDRPEVTYAYIARAVSPGDFMHPPATVEDMYRPEKAAWTATGRFTVLGPVR